VGHRLRFVYVRAVKKIGYATVEKSFGMCEKGRLSLCEAASKTYAIVRALQMIV
jgi:hypothetical protein